MTMLPAITEITDTYPNPSNAVARAGLAKFWNATNEFQQKSELDLASAATCDIGGQASTKLRITGTTGITSFGTNYRGPIKLRFSGAVAITHNATTLRCPGSANYTTTANEAMEAWPIASVSGTIDGWQLVSLSGGSLIGVAAITSGTITGITDLAIADGGTGASSAATAFANLKQAATTSATGVVELATDAEAQAGTDATRCVTPDNLGAVVIGLGQTWQNMTASRAVSTTYTNSTGRAIVLNIKGDIGSANQYITVTVGGVGVAYASGVGSTVVCGVQGVIVPNGATYSVAASAGTLTNLVWMELR